MACSSISVWHLYHLIVPVMLNTAHSSKKYIAIKSNDCKHYVILLEKMYGSNRCNNTFSIYSEVPNRRACSLRFFRFFSTLLAIFHLINKKFHHARLLTYLVKKQAGWNFFPTLLVYSGLLV